MKILWITNIILPELNKHLGKPSCLSGGWMDGLQKCITIKKPEVQLIIATVDKSVKEVKEFRIGNNIYLLLPCKRNVKPTDNKLINTWKNINIKYSPDVVHIHGTESPFGLAYILACGSNNVIVSIQGLLSGIARYSLANINIFELRKFRTIIDYMRDKILNKPKQMMSTANCELLYLKNVKHIIGRTSWDRIHAWSINPELNYHFCNEILRPDFYTQDKWSITKCERNTIFISQSCFPWKGFHNVILAIPYILRNYPNTKVYVAGRNFIERDKGIGGLKYSTYGNYCFNLIKKFQLKHVFHFCGPLTGKEMHEYYLKSHIFICASSIENSPNSLGEAQIIGTPCIASYVGGIPDMIKDGETGLLYRFDEYEMLAYNVCKLFGSDEISKYISEREIASAEYRHNRETNTNQMIQIYNLIAQNK